jgi:hypothetical protein
MNPMKFGITISRFLTADVDAGIGPELASIDRDAVQADLDSLWIMDHLLQTHRSEKPRNRCRCRSRTRGS